MQHLTSNDVDRLLRNKRFGVLVNDGHPVDYLVEAKKSLSHAYQFRVPFHIDNIRSLHGSEVGKHSGPPAEIDYGHTWTNRMAERLLKRGHPVGIAKHIVMIMQWDELAEYFLRGHCVVVLSAWVEKVPGHGNEAGGLPQDRLATVNTVGQIRHVTRATTKSWVEGASTRTALAPSVLSESTGFIDQSGKR